MTAPGSVCSTTSTAACCFTSNASGFGVYTANGLGQRVIKDADNYYSSVYTSEIWVHDEQGRLIGRYDTSGNALEELVYLNGFRPVATVRSTDIDRVLTDHLGTPRKVLAPLGTLLWSWDSKEPFGNSAPWGVGGLTFDLRFPGQIAAAESGLAHNGFREYRPRSGRFE